jgi:hypothetical protein
MAARRRAAASSSQSAKPTASIAFAKQRLDENQAAVFVCFRSFLAGFAEAAGDFVVAVGGGLPCIYVPTLPMFIKTRLEQKMEGTPCS